MLKLSMSGSPEMSRLQDIPRLGPGDNLWEQEGLKYFPRNLREDLAVLANNLSAYLLQGASGLDLDITQGLGDSSSITVPDSRIADLVRTAGDRRVVMNYLKQIGFDVPEVIYLSYYIVGGSRSYSKTGKHVEGRETAHKFSEWKRWWSEKHLNDKFSVRNVGLEPQEVTDRFRGRFGVD